MPVIDFLGLTPPCSLQPFTTDGIKTYMLASLLVGMFAGVASTVIVIKLKKLREKNKNNKKG